MSENELVLPFLRRTSRIYCNREYPIIRQVVRRKPFIRELLPRQISGNPGPSKYPAMDHAFFIGPRQHHSLAIEIRAVRQCGKNKKNMRVFLFPLGCRRARPIKGPSSAQTAADGSAHPSRREQKRAYEATARCTGIRISTATIAKETRFNGSGQKRLYCDESLFV